MKIDRQRHWQFLEDELRAETEVFNRKFSTKAEFLLNETEEMFVGQYLEFRNGEMLIKFPNSRTLPRKGEYFFCMVLPKEYRDYRNWGEKTYRDLFSIRFKGSECVCVWQSRSNDDDFSLVGFRKVELDFSEFLDENNANGIILVFAPQRPPIDYIINLQNLTKDQYSESVSKVLDSDYCLSDWTPTLIRHNNATSFVHSQLSLTETMILQGPPGTGKSYLIAELCNLFCKEGKSVLVTALTNRALMEIAEKPALNDLLRIKKVFKTSMTVDELHENKLLEPLRQLAPIKGALCLSTYFITSGFAAGLGGEDVFDVVIMDEASQALTAMFAAALKMGRINLWVGDVNQLAPIVSLNEDRIRSYNYSMMINGLQLMSDSNSHPIYQLTATYRLGDRAASYTGIFYKDTLYSKGSHADYNIYGLNGILNHKGGPSLILTDQMVGDYTPAFSVYLATSLAQVILSQSKNTEIAILTCMIKTTKSLQKGITQSIGTHKKILVETIARVQGLTTDITILVIPNVSYIRTLEPHLFNVATSRAKEHTIIIADKDILKYSSMNCFVRQYLERLYNEQMVYIPVNQTAQIKSSFISLLDNNASK